MRTATTDGTVAATITEVFGVDFDEELVDPGGAATEVDTEEEVEANELLVDEMLMSSLPLWCSHLGEAYSRGST